MKTSTIASALLGLLSSPVVSAEEPLQLKIPSGDDQYVFTLTKFMDGRSKPYRVYFWDDMLTGSSYRVDQNGDVVYFKAGSEVYFKMKEAEDGSITFKMKEERKMQKTVEEGSRRRKMLMTKDVMSDNDVEITKDMVVNEDRVMLSEDDERTAQCTECMDDLDVIGFTLPKFCQYVDFHSLGSDGQKSVKILCGYEKVLVDGLESICYDICYGPFCSNGLAGLEAGGVCCAAGCGECGGVGCSQRPGGQMDCCTSKIMEAKEPCDVTGKAPCIIEYDSEMMDSSDAVDSEEGTMDLECHKDSLSAEDQEQLTVYDTDVYLEAECVGDVIPNGCNIFDLGQECRSCFASCTGALLYVEDKAAEIAEKGEELIINFCPDSGESDLESCRSQAT